jgi:hypothetical protein
MSATAEVPAFDSDKPVTNFRTSYSQAFNTTWDGPTFFNQWDMVDSNLPFDASDMSAGYLQFLWWQKRIIRSKPTYTIPYIFSSVIQSNSVANGGGMVIRVRPNGNIYAMEEPGDNWDFFNSDGIAFYPTGDGQNMIVQFSATYNGSGATPQTRIYVPKPSGVTSLLNVQGAFRIEDFGASIYVYYNDARYIRIDLGGFSGGVYTSGTVYNADMISVGTFSSMEVLAEGKVGIAQRATDIKLYSAQLQIKDLGTNVNNSGNKFNIYQSGSSIIVDLTGLNGQQTVSVFNMNGKSMFIRNVNGGETLSISNDMKPGAYLIKVQGSDKSIMTKLILK